MNERRSRTARLACIMLAMSMACAVSGLLMDYRVMGLLRSARAGTFLHAELDRADEVATVLLLFTFTVNAACLLVFSAWFVRSSRATARESGLPRLLLLAIALVPLANPALPFLARTSESGQAIAMASRVVGIALAAVLIAAVRCPRPSSRVAPAPPGP